LGPLRRGREISLKGESLPGFLSPQTHQKEGWAKEICLAFGASRKEKAAFRGFLARRQPRTSSDSCDKGRERWSCSGRKNFTMTITERKVGLAFRVQN